MAAHPRNPGSNNPRNVAARIKRAAEATHTRSDNTHALQRDVAELKANVTSYDEKLQATSRKVGSLETKVDAHDKLLTDPRNPRGLPRVIELIELLDGRTVELERALEVGTQGGRKSFLRALRDANVSDEQLRMALTIIDDDSQELNLSDDELLT